MPKTGVEAQGRNPSAMAPFRAMERHDAGVIWQMFHIPEVCWAGNTVSPEILSQCDRFWKGYLTQLAIACVPLVLCVGLLLVGLDQLRAVYRKIRRKAQLSKPQKIGTVTDPARTSTDWLGWLFCFKGVKVQIAPGHQTRAYLPLDYETPAPGDSLALYEVDVFWGMKRIFATRPPQAQQAPQSAQSKDSLQLVRCV